MKEFGTYFVFDRYARPIVKGQTCFTAIKKGLVTAQTRFLQDQKRTNYLDWKTLKRGDLITLWSGPYSCELHGWTGESVVVRVTEAPRCLWFHNMTSKERRVWSIAEGWVPKQLDVWVNQGRSVGMQVHFELATAPKQLEFKLGLS